MPLSSGIQKLITIKRNYKTTGYNAADSLKTFASVWGTVQLGNGREYFAVKQIIPEIDAIIQLNQYVHGITNDMVIYIDGIKYEIIGHPKAIRELNFVELQIKRVN